MKEYILIEEEEAKELLTNQIAIDAITACFQEKAKGTFHAYAKQNIKGKNGNLCITPGESADLQKVIGFRLYDVIRSNFNNQPQLVVVYDNETGRLKGIIISQLLGAYRTAAINTVMHNYFKKSRVATLGLVGTGYQARIHFPMFYELLQPTTVKVFNRTKANAQLFIDEMKSKGFNNVDWQVCSNMESLGDVDSLLMTSRSKDELLKVGMLPNGVTVTTVGPKALGASEVEEGFANGCDLIITDAIEQVEKYGEGFFIKNKETIIDFSEVYNNQTLVRNNDEERIIICSVGMGGTEISLANKLIEKKLKMG